MCIYIHIQTYVRIFTHIQFTPTCHSCAQLPTQYLARSKSTVNIVEWIMLAAQNAKNPMVTKAPSEASLFLQTVQSCGTWQEVTLNQGECYLPVAICPHLETLLIAQAGEVYRNLLGGSWGCCWTTSKARNTSRLSSNRVMPKTLAVLKPRHGGWGITKPEGETF